MWLFLFQVCKVSRGVNFNFYYRCISPSRATTESNGLLPYTNNSILAVVDGEPLSLDDLKNSQIQDTMVQLYQMQSQDTERKSP